jgi:hypothetical protein
MNSAVLWPIVLVAAVVVLILIYFRRAELAKTRAELAKTRRVAQISAAAEHFSDLTARGILPIKLFAGEIPNVAL